MSFKDILKVTSLNCLAKKTPKNLRQLFAILSANEEEKVCGSSSNKQKGGSY